MRADARSNRQDLVEAAWKLLAAEGPDASLRAIAQEAGVGIATLYRHYPTRDDLILGVVDEVQARVREILERHAWRWEDSPELAWSGIVHDIAALQIGTLVHQVSPGIASSEALARGGVERRARALRFLEPVLRRAKDAGLVREDVRAEQLMLGLAAITRALPRGIDSLMPGQRDWLVDVYLRGLRP